MDDVRMQRFFDDLAASAPTAPVGQAEAQAVLDLARVVAHSIERKYAPIATYAAGLAADPNAGSEERAASIRAVIASVEAIAAEESG